MNFDLDDDTKLLQRTVREAVAIEGPGMRAAESLEAVA